MGFWRRKEARPEVKKVVSTTELADLLAVIALQEPESTDKH
jgi:hypothetical protein